MVYDKTIENIHKRLYFRKKRRRKKRVPKNDKKKKFGHGADYVSEEKINSPTVRKVSHFY